MTFLNLPTEIWPKAPQMLLRPASEMSVATAQGTCEKAITSLDFLLFTKTFTVTLSYPQTYFFGGGGVVGRQTSSVKEQFRGFRNKLLGGNYIN